MSENGVLRSIIGPERQEFSVMEKGTKWGDA